MAEKLNAMIAVIGIDYPLWVDAVEKVGDERSEAHVLELFLRSVSLGRSPRRPKGIGKSPFRQLGWLCGGRKPKLRLTQYPRTELLAGLLRQTIASQEQLNGLFDMSAHFLPLERLEAWRDEPKKLVVGDNRPEKEFGGKLGFGAAQLPAPRGAAEVVGKLAINAPRSLRIKNAAELGHTDGFRDHDPVE